MSILLDKDEMEKLPKVIVLRITTKPEVVAKAQLKKFAEWGEETCREHPGEYEECPKGQCSICWQALLKEVKE